MSALQTTLLATAVVCGLAVYLLWPTEQQLESSADVLSRLAVLRAEQKYVDPHGIIKPEERARLEPIMNALLDRLISGLPSNPKKSWAISEMKKTVAQFYLEDTELRDPSIEYIRRVISILGIRSTDRAFYRYMVFI